MNADPSLDWFAEARFGMFVHWGVYALAARQEWVMNVERIPISAYSKYARHFDPDLFDPAQWARSARMAGMTYVVLTTKHHDGFCLWDSDVTEYKSTNTPAGRDLVAEFVEAVRAEGLRVGFYYSLLDWHHPEFTIDGHHPRRDEDRAALDAENERRDMRVYRAYMRDQLTELLGRYGAIDYLFFDFSYENDHNYPVWGAKGAQDWDSVGLMKLARELQPGILINDRLDIPGDFVTPEQYQPDKPMERDAHPVPWEACQTINGRWGYLRDGKNIKTLDLLIRMLVDGVSKNGNLLLNVGPTGRGELDPVAVDTLDDIAKWMRLHDRSVRGCGASSFVPPPDARYTQNGRRLYLHLFAWPLENVHLAGLAGKVEYVQLLNDASEILFREIPPDRAASTMGLGGQPAGTLTLTVPVIRPDVSVPVIEIFLSEP